MRRTKSNLSSLCIVNLMIQASVLLLIVVIQFWGSPFIKQVAHISMYFLIGFDFVFVLPYFLVWCWIVHSFLRY